MLFLKILAFVFLVPGALMAFLSRDIVERLGLDKKTRCDFEHEMTEDELIKYKENKAVVNVKMAGMLVALPGLILVLVAFR